MVNSAHEKAVSSKNRSPFQKLMLVSLWFFFLPMTNHNLNSDKELPRGLAPNFIAPFSGKLSNETAKAALANLPKALEELRTKWQSIDSVRASGLSPTFEGGPLDDAVRQGVWHAELQIPMPTAGGLPGSKGIKQVWPHENSSQRAGPQRIDVRAGSGFSWLNGVGANLCSAKGAHQTLWANEGQIANTWLQDGHMRWSKPAPPTASDNTAATPQHSEQKSEWRQWGARGSRGGKQKRGGQVRTRGQDPNRNQDYMSVIFANITSYSAHAAFYISGRSEDVLLFAETHQDKEKTFKMISELGTNGWQTTASPAQPSDRSILGNIAGVAVSVKNFINNRASSLAIDAKGNLSENPFVTARTVVMESHEILALSAYLEGGGLKGNNLRTLEAIDHITRGGKDLFFCGLDANVEPKAWDTHMAGTQTWLDKHNAEIVTVENSTFTCKGKSGTEGGSNIDYFIMSKPLVALVVYLGALFDVPWGPHFGLALTLYAKPDELLLRMLVKPNLPTNILEVMLPKPKVKAKPIENKILRQKARDEEHARDFAEKAEDGDRWSQQFLETPFADTELTTEDAVQKEMLQYAFAMGIPTQGNALSDNFSRWGRTLAGYISDKCEQKPPEALKQTNSSDNNSFGSTPKNPSACEGRSPWTTDPKNVGPRGTNPSKVAEDAREWPPQLEGRSSLKIKTRELGSAPAVKLEKFSNREAATFEKWFCQEAEIYAYEYGWVLEDSFGTS